MIDYFNEVPMRKSGVVFSSTLEQIKKLYEVNPAQAGELAISAIELVLTGQVSSNDVLIDLMLEPARAISQTQQDKYDTKVESSKQKKIVEYKLDKIAELLNHGLKQKDVGKTLGLSQQTISYRVGLIKKMCPEMLNEELVKGKSSAKKTVEIEEETVENEVEIDYSKGFSF